ncbi:DUF2158 domain-containing protein [Pseudomonas alabamensis]|uniref:YodC family protein n=1 Tax=Pseudomonas alabamensis TaxID=3064349 RepID=UPI0011A2033F
MSDFKKGDLVMLRSGGPKMTVADIDDFSEKEPVGPKDGVKCQWFEGNEVYERVFDSAVLKEYEPRRQLNRNRW